jgi:hypothetical protein
MIQLPRSDDFLKREVAALQNPAIKTRKNKKLAAQRKNGARALDRI